MQISRFFSLLTSALGCLLLTQCASQGPGSGPAAPYVPRVSMPDSSQLSANENRYLPEVEDVLVEAGYRPTQGRAEYRLDIHLEDGPVNADSHLRMLRGNEEIANASARVGGMTTMFRRARVVEDSFRKCLGSFQSQLSSARPRDDRNGQWNEAPPAQEQADWQRGW